MRGLFIYFEDYSIVDITFQLQRSNTTQIMTNTITVPKQPPPNLLAPYPAINPLKMLFIVLMG